jgi:hypothetical protein
LIFKFLDSNLEDKDSEQNNRFHCTLGEKKLNGLHSRIGVFGWRWGIPLSPGIESPPSGQHFCHFNETAFEHTSHFKTPWPALGPTQPHIQWVPWFSPPSPEIKGRGVKLTTTFHRVPCLRMGGVLPPLPKYAIMSGTRRNALSYCISIHHIITPRNASSFRSTGLEDSLFSRRQPRDPNLNQMTPGHDRNYLAHTMKAYYNWSLYSTDHLLFCIL